METPFRAQKYVTQASAVQKHGIRDVAAVSHLDGFIGREQIRALGAKRASLSANGAIAKDIALVGVAIDISDIPIEETALRQLYESGQVGVGRFGTEIKVMQDGELGEVNSGVVGRAPGIADWRNFIFHEGVLIESQPFSQTGNSITKIKSRAPVSWIQSNTRSVSCGQKRPLGCAHCTWELWPSPQAGTPEADFKILVGQYIYLTSVL